VPIPIIIGKQPLSEELIRKAQPRGKQYKLYDSGGLFLIVAPAGGKWWRFKYRFEGKEKTISLGTFPKISLSKARALRDNARQLLKQGKNPSAVRKAEKAEREQAGHVVMPSIRILMDGTIELWKDRDVIHFSPDEARLVANKLSALVRCTHGID